MKYLRFFEENNKEFSKEFKKYIGKYVILDYSKFLYPDYLLCRVIDVGLGQDNLYRVFFDYYSDIVLDVVGPSSLQLKNFKVIEVFDKLEDAKERYHMLMNTKKYNL